MPMRTNWISVAVVVKDEMYAIATIEITSTKEIAVFSQRTKYKLDFYTLCPDGIRMQTQTSFC